MSFSIYVESEEP